MGLFGGDSRTENTTNVFNETNSTRDGVLAKEGATVVIEQTDHGAIEAANLTAQNAISSANQAISSIANKMQDVISGSEQNLARATNFASAISSDAQFTTQLAMELTQDNLDYSNAQTSDLLDSAENMFGRSLDSMDDLSFEALDSNSRLAELAVDTGLDYYTRGLDYSDIVNERFTDSLVGVMGDAVGQINSAYSDAGDSFRSSVETIQTSAGDRTNNMLIITAGVIAVALIIVGGVKLK